MNLFRLVYVEIKVLNMGCFNRGHNALETVEMILRVAGPST